MPCLCFLSQFLSSQTRVRPKSWDNQTQATEEHDPVPQIWKSLLFSVCSWQRALVFCISQCNMKDAVIFSVTCFGALNMDYSFFCYRICAQLPTTTVSYVPMPSPVAGSLGSRAGYASACVCLQFIYHHGTATAAISDEEKQNKTKNKPNIQKTEVHSKGEKTWQ